MAHAGAADVGCEKGARAEEGRPGVERACSSTVLGARVESESRITA